MSGDVGTEVEHDDWCPINGCRCGNCGPCMGPPLCSTSPDVGAEVAAVLHRAILEHEGVGMDCDYLAERLAPLIAARVEAAKAEALREAADECGKRYTTAAWLRDRAAALDPENRREK